VSLITNQAHGKYIAQSRFYQKMIFCYWMFKPDKRIIKSPGFGHKRSPQNAEFQAFYGLFLYTAGNRKDQGGKFLMGFKQPGLPKTLRLAHSQLVLRQVHRILSYTTTNFPRRAPPAVKRDAGLIGAIAGKDRSKNN
jgi:hypothetical protein